MKAFQPTGDLEADFLTECHELLDYIEADLSALDQDGAETKEDVVNRIFRAAHSIKSGAGFFDLAVLRDLAQKIESAIDLIRSRQMPPSHEVVDLLSHGFDQAGDLIEQYRKGEPADVSQLVAVLDELIVDHLPFEEKFLFDARVEVALPQAGGIVEASVLDLMQARRRGKSIYLIRYDLMRDIQRQGKTPWEVFKSLIESGTILETVLDLHSAGTLNDPPSNQLPLVVLYATPLELERVAALAHIPAERIQLVETNRAS
ncbi:MAG TPA: Hpt domain-containing protein [Bryobacteraceae bacterium]|nr:Hpt domain-containing protein [Bryobacteraceae bacterium]